MDFNKMQQFAIEVYELQQIRRIATNGDDL
jgi:hypothetical protein